MMFRILAFDAQLDLRVADEDADEKWGDETASIVAGPLRLRNERGMDLRDGRTSFGLDVIMFRSGAGHVQ